MTTDTQNRALVIINGDDTHHDLLTAVSVLQDLTSQAGFATTRGSGMHRFVNPLPATENAGVYVLYLSGGAFATEQQEALSQAIAEGKGVVALHASSVVGLDHNGEVIESDKPFAGMLGSHYLSHGPGHHEGHQYIDIDPSHPITQGVTNFDIFDEYYEFQFSSDAQAKVLASRTRVQDGAEIPVMYAREHGAGRVVYLALGHDLRSWGTLGFKQLFSRAVQWAAAWPNLTGLGER